MIFLEIPFFRHYVFCVVQTSSSPTHPGGNPPLIKVRARVIAVGRGRRGVRSGLCGLCGLCGQNTDAPHHAPRTTHRAPRTTHRAPRILPLLFSRKRRKAPSQPGRLRYFLNRMQAYPPEQQPYKNLRVFRVFRG
jgi:hypothetical protein